MCVRFSRKKAEEKVLTPVVRKLQRGAGPDPASGGCGSKVQAVVAPESVTRAAGGRRAGRRVCRRSACSVPSAFRAGPRGAYIHPPEVATLHGRLAE
jgi:hypothetical protein